MESREFVAFSWQTNHTYACTGMVDAQLVDELNGADSQAERVNGKDVKSKLPQDGARLMNRGGFDDDRAFTSEGIGCHESSLRMPAEHEN